MNLKIKLMNLKNYAPNHLSASFVVSKYFTILFILGLNEISISKHDLTNTFIILDNLILFVNNSVILDTLEQFKDLYLDLEHIFHFFFIFISLFL